MSSHSDLLDKYMELLASPSDTSKFVALTILPRILSQDDPSAIRRCWENMDLQFLDKLLMADELSQRSSETEAVDLRSAGVNILTAFVSRSELRGIEMYRRIPALISALNNSDDTELRSTILDTLAILSGTPAGAEELVRLPSALKLAELVINGYEAEDTHLVGSKVLQILKSSYVLATSSQSANPESLTPLLNLLSQSFAKSVHSRLQLHLLTFFSSLFLSMSPSFSAYTEKWTKNIYEALQAISMSRQTDDRRSEITILIAALLNIYGPNFLFSYDSNEENARKFAMLTVRLCTASLTSTLENLLPQITSPQYPSIAARLSADFDIVYFTTIFLLNLEDSSLEKQINLTPDDILHIHSLLQQTLSSTLIFLRDRWDVNLAAVDNIPKSGAKLLGWDISLDGGVTRDPVVIAAVRCLALWLREDDWNTKETFGVLDVLLGLWKKGLDDERGFGYGRYVAQALEGILVEKSGPDEVVRMGGWEVIESDLKKELDREIVDWTIVEEDVDLLTEIVQNATVLSRDSVLMFAKFVAEIGLTKGEVAQKEKDLPVYVKLLALATAGLIKRLRGVKISEIDKNILRMVFEGHKDAIRIINEIREEKQESMDELLAPLHHQVDDLAQLINI